jgi:hypothetical protein
MNQAKIVKESIEFERGIEPAEAMGIGIKKWLVEFEGQYFRLKEWDKRLDAKNKLFQVLVSYPLEEIIPCDVYNDFFQGVREKDMRSFKLDNANDIVFSTDGFNGVIKVFYNNRWKLVALNSETSIGKEIVNHLIKKVEQGNFIEFKRRMVKEEISASEALYGFCGWLTTRDEPVTMSAKHNAAIVAELVDEYIQKQKLKEPKDHWEKQLKEELIGRANNREVYKNPPSIKNFSDWTRAISTKSGDLYVAEKYDLVHITFIKYLRNKGILKSNEGWDTNAGTYVNMMAWQRYKNTNKFYLSESYHLNISDNMKKMTQTTRNKNPQFKFYLKRIPNNVYF